MGERDTARRTTKSNAPSRCNGAVTSNSSTGPIFRRIHTFRTTSLRRLPKTEAPTKRISLSRYDPKMYSIDASLSVYF